ncbi:hypothetical protein [Dyella tabacisoli]|nr:hypothetical protein [Dyella tabacisoli]
MATAKQKSVTECPYERVVFTPEDHAVMDAALDYSPELRLCAGIARVARKSKLKYPVKSVQDLLPLLPKKPVFAEGHHLRAGGIETYMRKEYFPIADERELISRCYLALMACNEAMRWAAMAPANAQTLLKEYRLASQPKGAR